MHLSQHIKSQNKVDLSQLRHVINRLEMEQSERIFTPVGVSEIDQILSGGLEQNALHEIIGPAATLLTSWWLSLIKGPMAWVSLKQDNIRPYMPGLKAVGLDPRYILHVQLDNFDQLLSATHRVLRDPAIATVVIDLDQPLSLSQARQWQLAAQKGETTGFILGNHKARINSPDIKSCSLVNSSITRWHGSVENQHHDQTHIQLELMKNRYGPEADFLLSLDYEPSHAAYNVSLVAPSANRAFNQAPAALSA